jgi:hypothetical protein
MPNNQTPRLTDKQVEWVINDSAELGVKIGDQFFFLYKGESLVYESGLHDNGSQITWRPVGKREFGESCYPPRMGDMTTKEYFAGPGSTSFDWSDLPPALEKPKTPGQRDLPPKSKNNSDNVYYEACAIAALQALIAKMPLADRAKGDPVEKIIEATARSADAYAVEMIRIRRERIAEAETEFRKQVADFAAALSRTGVPSAKPSLKPHQSVGKDGNTYDHPHEETARPH